LITCGARSAHANGANTLFDWKELRWREPQLLDRAYRVPSGATVYMLKHVLHGYEDAAAAEILGHCRSVLPADGRVLVIEFVLPDVVGHADRDLEQRLMSDLNMLVVTGGKERSATE
jgi:hypothetical protein